MKVTVYKSRTKNLMSEYIGIVDFGDTQIQVITPIKKERDRLTKEAKKIIKSK